MLVYKLCKAAFWFRGSNCSAVGLPIKEESIIVRPVVLIVSLDVLPRLLAVLLGLRFDQSIPAEYFSH